MKRQEILDILGVDEASNEVIKEFKQLAKKYEANDIWLKGDTPYYEKCGVKVAETEHLVATLPFNVDLDLFDILDEHIIDSIGEQINEFLFKKYGAIPSAYGYDTPLNIKNISWEVEE